MKVGLLLCAVDQRGKALKADGIAMTVVLRSFVVDGNYRNNLTPQTPGYNKRDEESRERRTVLRLSESQLYSARPLRHSRKIHLQTCTTISRHAV